jgi:predicted  nucleic acid-binding Zn-ribbon protein
VTPIIENLLVIQDHDLRIMKFEKEIADIPQRKAAIDSLLDEHRQAVVKAKDAFKGRQLEIKKAELEIESARERIRKFREQQMQLKSNREFRVMEDEIETVEKGIRQVEDRILTIMETVEVAQGGVKERENDLKGEEGSVTGEMTAIDQRAADIKNELGRVKESRAKVAAGIDEIRLHQYERLFQNKHDKVLVAVENATCGGCHMKLPPYVCHEARKQNEVILCGFCGRMLY